MGEAIDALLRGGKRFESAVVGRHQAVRARCDRTASDHQFPKKNDALGLKPVPRLGFEPRARLFMGDLVRYDAEPRSFM